MPATLRTVVELMDGWYDPAWAEPWDAVGLVYRRPRPARSGSVLFAVDPAPAVVDEAVTSAPTSWSSTTRCC